MDCSPPGSSVHGILQARILEGVAISSSRGSSQSRDRTCVSYVSCIGRQVLYHYHHLGSPYISPFPLEPPSPSTLSHRSGLLQSLSLSCLHVIFLSYWKDSGYFLLLVVLQLASLVTPDLSYLLRPLPLLKLYTHTNHALLPSDLILLLSCFSVGILNVHLDQSINSTCQESQVVCCDWGRMAQNKFQNMLYKMCIAQLFQNISRLKIFFNGRSIQVPQASLIWNFTINLIHLNSIWHLPNTLKGRKKGTNSALG